MCINQMILACPLVRETLDSSSISLSISLFLSIKLQSTLLPFGYASSSVQPSRRGFLLLANRACSFTTTTTTPYEEDVHSHRSLQ